MWLWLVGLALAESWTPLAPGLELLEVTSPVPSTVGDSTVRVVRVDPERWELELAMAMREEHGPISAPQWAERHELAVVINAAMFEPSGRSTFFMVDGAVANNPTLRADKDVLAFGAVASGTPPVAIIDRGCDDFAVERKKYTTFVQSIRMLSCDGRNVWSQSTRIWSHAAIGVDSSGRVLLIHARSPWSTHDFIDIVRALPLDLARLQYAEGGPEASLAVKVGPHEHSLVGSYETGFFESDANTRAWSLPSVIGVRARTAVEAKVAPAVPEPG